MSALYRDRAYASVTCTTIKSNTVSAKTVTEGNGSASTVLKAMLEPNAPIGTNNYVLVSANTTYAKVPAAAHVKSVHQYTVNALTVGSGNVKLETDGTGVLHLLPTATFGQLNSGQYRPLLTSNARLLASNVQSDITSVTSNYIYVDLEYVL